MSIHGYFKGTFTEPRAWPCPCKKASSSDMARAPQDADDAWIDFAMHCEQISNYTRIGGKNVPYLTGLRYHQAIGKSENIKEGFTKQRAVNSSLFITFVQGQLGYKLLHMSENYWFFQREEPFEE
jgi:hypothetical protein